MLTERMASVAAVFGVTATDRVAEALERAHATQEKLNAFTHIDDEGARARAAEIDEAIQRGEYAGPLAGVPVALKDLIDQRGQITTCGSAFYRHRAETDAPCVEAIEKAGGIVIGRTGLHEWAFGFSSENPHWGPVRNPWDPATSTGGSSGGSAAAVAAGITPLAIGTDTGGSVRVPAALCGTFGLKVTYGRISLDGVFPLVPSIDTVGPLADSAEHLELAYRAMSGDDTPEPGPRPLRFGIPQPWYDDAPTADDVVAGFGAAVSALREMGHEVHTIEMTEAVPSKRIWNAIAEEVREIHRPFRERGEVYGADVAQRLDDAEKVTAEEAAEAKAWQQTLRDQFADAFATVDFLITPTVPVRRKIIGEDRLQGRHYRSVLSYFTALVNHSLHPALALPLAGSGAPPASLQIIAPRNQEVTLLALARRLETGGISRFTTAPGEYP
ncbi:MAG TPA: amidase [Acidimicrobiia bacterium]|nr:amidase [Acidimicrobiia bacterium]